jgi:hypothetical protein
VIDPRLLCFGRGLYSFGTGAVQMGDAVGYPFDVLLYLHGHVGQHRWALRAGDGEEIGKS